MVYVYVRDQWMKRKQAKLSRPTMTVCGSTAQNALICALQCMDPFQRF